MYICTHKLYYVYIYIYIEREIERERGLDACVCIYIYIYIYIHILYSRIQRRRTPGHCSWVEQLNMGRGPGALT